MDLDTKKILLVEDEAIIALLETRQLGNEGYDVTHAVSGEKAVELINSGRAFDLVLMDIDLGSGMDGTEAASLILQANEIPILFLSSHTEKDVVSKTESISSYGYVVKNSGIRVLDASIKMAFKLFDAHRILRSRKQKLLDVNSELQRTIEELQSTNEELEAANEQLLESERIIMERDYLLNMTGSIARVGGWEYNISSRALAWTDEVARIHEFTPGMEADVFRIYGLYTPESQQQINEALRNAIKHMTPFDLELQLVTLSGVRKHLRTSGRVNAENGRSAKIQGVLQDISDRKAVESEVNRINRIYSVISRVNQLIVSTRDLERIFSESCRIAVECGRFRMAWIGLIDEEEQAVIPRTWHGHEEGYLSMIKKISVKDVPEGRGPTGTAIREGRFFYCNDISNDPIMAPWRDEALKRGYRSSIALPVMIGSRPAGAFSIYSSEANYFNDTEISLLLEMTGDIAYAMENINLSHKGR